MSKPAITVENLSKAYRIGLKEEIPDTLMSALTGFARSPWKNFRDLRRLNTFGKVDERDSDLYWALKDVSFEIKEGEVLGVIGRNGAGKSTLLKILSRITEPTRGRAIIRGRVSSLLEVGTGFHPELSGRENIYLNGTILGMTKREIDLKFDEIVDFSGVEKFLDTPVKRYSSGMKVRLAFSVAAHLEPEILIIDEVLAVGDIEFQNKCLGKMQDVVTGGRTVLFVSHNMAMIQQLCTAGLLIESGKPRFYGDVAPCIEKYGIANSQGNRQFCVSPDTPNRITDAYLINARGERSGNFGCGEPLQICIRFSLENTISKPHCVVEIYNESGIKTASIGTFLTDKYHSDEKGACLIGNVESLDLAPGSYSISIRIGTLHNDLNECIVDRAIEFIIQPNNYYGGGKMPNSQRGALLVRSSWRLTNTQSEAN